jgi:hypothetical protein
MIRYQTLSQLHGNVNIGSPSAASWLQYFSNSRLYNSKDISPLEIVQFERYFSTGDRTIQKIFLHWRSYNSKDISPLEIIQFKRYFSTQDRTIWKIFLHLRNRKIRKIFNYREWRNIVHWYQKEKYRTLVPEEEILYTGTRRRICFSYDQYVKNILKLLISIVNDRWKEIDGNSHAEI